MTKGKVARENFMNGLNCSQAVAVAFADEMNMPKELVAKLTIGFGGGIGRMREVTVKDVNGQRYIGCALDEGKTVEATV